MRATFSSFLFSSSIGLLDQIWAAMSHSLGGGFGFSTKQFERPSVFLEEGLGIEALFSGGFVSPSSTRERLLYLVFPPCRVFVSV